MSNYGNLEIDQFADAFKALANPHRLSIFLRLVSCCGGAACGPAEEIHPCVGELGKDLEIAPSTVSHHIKELRQAGLIRVQRRGQSVDCQIDRPTLAALRELLDVPQRHRVDV